MVATRSGGGSGGSSAIRDAGLTVPVKRSQVKKRKPAARATAGQSAPTKAKVSPSAKKALLESQKKASPNPGAIKPPDGWNMQYKIIQELRTVRDAPVDEFGSEALPAKNVPQAVFRYQVLIALMLSSQTRDQVVGSAMRKLQAHGLTVENILRTEDEVLRSMLFGVGFYNNKTKYIKQTSQILLDKYGGDVPNTAKELCALPGIGPKMAYIILNVAHGVVTGIGIDTHMHRIMNQLRWMQTKTPEQTRAALESWLPQDEWGKINIVFVGFGQQIQTEPTKLLVRACGCLNPPATFQLLRKVGVDVNARDAKNRKRTALHQVATRTGAANAMTPEQQLQYLQRLLDAGAKAALKDADGQTAVELAGPAIWAQLESV